MNSDAILLSGLKVPIKIGCTSEERAFPQNLEIHCEVSMDLSSVHSLHNTICYMRIRDLILSLAQEQEWVLLEEFAEGISKTIFSQFPLAEAVNLELRKFILSDGNWVGIRTYRRRQ